MQAKITYQFSGKLWKHNGQGAWYFVSLPVDMSKEIRAHLKWQEEGWGRMKAEAIINTIAWETAIWFDKKANTYLLPIKSDIRRKAKLKVDETYNITILV